MPTTSKREGRGRAPTPLHPLAAILKQAGLTQIEFALLGGWLPSTVNRWCRQRPSDARPVPRHVMVLALCYLTLTAEQRAQVLEALEAGPW